MLKENVIATSLAFDLILPEYLSLAFCWTRLPTAGLLKDITCVSLISLVQNLTHQLILTLQMSWDIRTDLALKQNRNCAYIFFLTVCREVAIIIIFSNIFSTNIYQQHNKFEKFLCDPDLFCHSFSDIEAFQVLNQCYLLLRSQGFLTTACL